MSSTDFRVIERRYVTIKEALSHLTQVELDTMITKVRQAKSLGAGSSCLMRA